MIRVSIVGATGYTGNELAAICLRHPRITLTSLTTRQEKPPAARTLIPSLPKSSAIRVEKFNLSHVIRNSDAAFLCLPHTSAMDVGAALLKAGKIVIDLSADFRLNDAKQYPKWYQVTHKKPALLKQAVYGLPEFYRTQIKQANLIANPGCYPTSVTLGLLPFLTAKLIATTSIIVDSKSGVSGAGRKLVESSHFCEVSENFKAYKANVHQHMPEINQVLTDMAKKKMEITFVPHLLPIKRGILSTIYTEVKKGVTAQRLQKVLEATYQKEPFVRVRPYGELPQIKEVANTNFCDIGITFNSRTRRLVIVSVIDNLLKGASGQAVQNFNIRFGLPETMGLN